MENEFQQAIQRKIEILERVNAVYKDSSDYFSGFHEGAKFVLAEMKRALSEFHEPLTGRDTPTPNRP